MTVIDVKPATTLEEVTSQIEEAMSYSVERYTRVCDVVLGQWLMVCQSIDVDALLNLAEELDKEAERKESSCWDRSVATVGTSYVREISRQIREALGASE